MEAYAFFLDSDDFLSRLDCFFFNYRAYIASFHFKLRTPVKALSLVDSRYVTFSLESRNSTHEIVSHEETTAANIILPRCSFARNIQACVPQVNYSNCLSVLPISILIGCILCVVSPCHFYSFGTLF